MERIWDDDSARHEITRLEGLIEKLNDQIAWCAKISLAAKIAVAGGAVWFVLAQFGVLPGGAVAFVGSLSALLGGVVLLGSNETTWNQYEANLEQTQAARAALIGRMGLRVVGDAPRTLH
ncbi:MAG: hypothetical protein Q7T81_04405 [Pseudolabrys sp.]|nr:hypothetical protein [Pseudolabrys sp.]